jgi:predicted TIM-barrel fold metal-dependent hydrolase
MVNVGLVVFKEGTKMAIASASKAAQIRARLSHPIVDADAHMLEVVPVLEDYLKQVGGSRMVERLRQYFSAPGDNLFDHVAGVDWGSMTRKERRDTGTMHPFWWFLPSADTRYRASVHLPKLFYERLDEFGLDFAVIFPTWGIALIALPGIQDDELRRAACRAYNLYAAELYGEYADRMTAAATIPANTPQEAIEELEYAVKVLGLKVALLPSYIVRPISRDDGNARIPEGKLAPYHVDVFGIDSDYDYDPLWAKCLELGVAPCFHSTANGIPWATRRSFSNLMYNTMGNFAESGDALAKALFLGGVTRRFPKLRLGLLEGGVGRGVMLYSDLVGWWEKRNPQVLRKYMDPAKLDQELMAQLIDEYGHDKVRAKKEEIMQGFRAALQAPHPDSLDDWEGAKIERAEQFRELFEPNFYYGCEADDPTTAWAFNTKVNPFGAKIRTMFSSDIGHSDVLDPIEVVPEAYEMVEHGLLTEEDFRDFVFSNAVRLYGGMNPDFFKGTPVEAAAEKVLASE